MFLPTDIFSRWRSYHGPSSLWLSPPVRCSCHYMFLPLKHGHNSSTEYWQFAEPAEATHVQRCLGPEDPMCSDSIGEHPSNCQD